MLQEDKVGIFRVMLSGIQDQQPYVRRALAILMFLLEEQDKRVVTLTERLSELEETTAELDSNMGCLFDEMSIRDEPETRV